MRNQLPALSAPAAAEELAIDVEHFPDENFRKIVSDNYDRDKNGKLSTQEMLSPGPEEGWLDGAEEHRYPQIMSSSNPRAVNTFSICSTTAIF